MSGLSEGYLYEATIQSTDGDRYTIEESNQQSTQGNIYRTVVSKKIIGSMNYSVLLTEHKKMLGTFVSTNRNVNIRYEKDSKDFFYIAKADALWNPDMTVLVDLNATVTQNIVEPVGQYELNAVLNNNGETKVNMTKPDGTIVDPGIYKYADEYGASLDHLQGWIFWATTDEATLMDFAAWLVSFVFIVINPGWVIGLTLTIIDGIAMSGDLMAADNAGTEVRMFYVLTIEFLGVPFFTEAGFYTNQIDGDPLYNWYYIPLFSTLLYHVGFNYAHTGIWPIWI